MKKFLTLLFCLVSVWASAQPLLRTALTTNTYRGNLAAASVFNVTNHGVVPYVPNSVGSGAFPTNGVYTDNFTALSNLFLLVSNQPAPRVVYFPPGVYASSGTLTLPPLTSIKGEGWLHQGGAGATRVSTSGSVIATNNWSILWFTGTSQSTFTNGTALRVPYTALGPISISNFEICGATNPLAALGQGFNDAAAIEMLPDTNVAFCGINFDGNTFCGGFKVENFTVTGFRVGVNHAGNFCTYVNCNFNGNNIGFLCTNIWAPDQVYFKLCSVGNKQGGVGYWVAGGRGWINEDPSDIDYFCWAVLLKNKITVIGGNSELNSTTAPSWTFFQDGAQTYYMSNSWPFARKGYIQTAYHNTTDNSSEGVLTVIGSQFSNGAGTMDCFVVDNGGRSSAAYGIKCINISWDTTNTYGGVPVLACVNAYRSDAIQYLNSSERKSAAVELWRGFGASGLKYISYVGEHSMAGDTEYQLNYQRDFVFGALSGAFTNLVQARWGFLELQQGSTTEGDWPQFQAGSNYTSAGLPNMTLYRLFQSDPGPLTIDGRPNTNLTLMHLNVRGNTTVTNLTLAKTNAAPTSVTIGVTTADRWFPVTNNGLIYMIPGWTNH